jgi:hypothetical protein
MKEIRGRTRVVGAFPDGQSCLNLAAARLRHIAGTTWSIGFTSPLPNEGKSTVAGALAQQILGGQTDIVLVSPSLRVANCSNEDYQQLRDSFP